MIKYGEFTIFDIQREDKEFPQRLLMRKDCPQKLYVGCKDERVLEIMNQFSLSVIGARKCSIRGTKIATQVASALCENRN